MAVDRKRIEDIQKRKIEREKANKRKIYMLRRAATVLIAIGILAAAVFGIRACVLSIQAHLAEKAAEEAARIAAEEAAKPTPTPEPVYTSKGINETYYTNCAFFGNSYIDGMEIYELVPGADYFSKIGLTVSQAVKIPTDTGTVPVVEEFSQGKQYDKIFMMFGENEIGWIGNAFFEQYEALIDKVILNQPNAKIYLLAIPPISKKVSDKDEDGLNIDRIKEYNSGIKTIAQNVGATYVDVFSPIVGEDGYLPADAATDGVHFGEDYYIKCLIYIQEHYK